MRSRTPAAIAFTSLVLVGGSALAGCAGASNSATHSMAPETTIAARAQSTAGLPGSFGGGKGAAGGSIGQLVSPSQPLIIRTGTVTLGAAKSHIVNVFNDVSGAANTLGGFVASSSSNSASDTDGASLVVRVPSDRFGDLVTRVDGFGKDEAQSENGNDVTGESINLTARIDNLTSEEAALRALLKHTGTITSILDVQNQLFSVEGEIEQLTAQQGSLLNQVTYATLTVTIAPLAAAPPAKPKPANSVSRAAKLAVHNSAVAVRSIVLALGWAFPALVIGIVALIAWRLRRRTGSRPTPAPATEPAS